MLEITGDKRLYQWDTDKTANVSVDCDEVHFSNLKFGKAFIVDVVGGVVGIPDELLQSGETIYAWAFVRTEGGGHTRQDCELPVTKRAKPNDYVYTPNEIITLKDLAKKDTELQEQIDEIATSQRAVNQSLTQQIENVRSFATNESIMREENDKNLQSQIDAINETISGFVNVAEVGA